MAGAGAELPPVGARDCATAGVTARLANAPAPNKTEAVKAVLLFTAAIPHLHLALLAIVDRIATQAE